MNTRTYYESLIIKDIKEIPEESLPIFLSFLQNFKNLLGNALPINSNKVQSTGLCGSWQDKRNPDEIIKEIEQGADYFSSRDFL